MADCAVCVSYASWVLTNAKTNEPLTVCQAGVLISHFLFALLVLVMMYNQILK